MESQVARKESYRDHKGALRERGARDEEKTDTEWQVLAFGLVDTVHKKINKQSKKASGCLGSSDQLI